jgi:hypothetical protein
VGLAHRGLRPSGWALQVNGPNNGGYINSPVHYNEPPVIQGNVNGPLTTNYNPGDVNMNFGAWTDVLRCSSGLYSLYH